jgi:biofilm PGA synthesis lipoprotein PgaB
MIRSVNVTPSTKAHNFTTAAQLALVALLGLTGIFEAMADETPVPHLVVLQYHHVSSATPASTSISPQQFASHLNWLADNGFHVVPLAEALDKIRAGEALPDKTAAITFDDGYLDNYTTAFPLLKERGWPFTIFVNPAPHDAGQSGWASWEQLREMAAAGATIANHTSDHSFLIRRNQGESDEAWLDRNRQDIERAEQRIEEETGQSHKLLAYPYGESNKAIRKLITDMGFIAFGQQSGSVSGSSDFADLPRFPLSGIYSALDSFKTKMLSLPMDVAEVTPATASRDNILAYSESQPLLTLKLANKEPKTLNCFASGQGAIQVETKSAGIYAIQAAESLATGRSRYNCTYASNWPGRFYWYSYAWIRRDKNEQWTHQ